MKRLSVLALTLLGGILMVGCGGGGGTDTVTIVPGPTVTVTPAAPARIGDPLTGLTADQAAQFEDGLSAFLKVDAEADGLGPIFNGNSCAECHAVPTTGGGAGFIETRFGNSNGGQFNDLANEGGSLFHLFSLPGTPQQTIPSDANVVAHRRTLPLFGLGLVEAIPDSAIKANALAEANTHPAHAGQVSLVQSASGQLNGDNTLHVGRFGWKCQQPTLLDFSGDAYVNEMGISNFIFPFENQPNNAVLPVDPGMVDDVTDGGLNCTIRFANYMRLLAPVPTGTGNANGEQLFTTIGCADCHTPSFTTVSPIDALNNKSVRAFSDFLLHDVGTGDGIAQGDAPPNKIRTGLLMGIGQETQFLHDGSVGTIEDAIAAHGNEGADASAAFQNLSASDQQDVVNFIKSL